jgi:hypothetical protein
LPGKPYTFKHLLGQGRVCVVSLAVGVPALREIDTASNNNGYDNHGKDGFYDGKAGLIIVNSFSVFILEFHYFQYTNPGYVYQS